MKDTPFEYVDNEDDSVDQELESISNYRSNMSSSSNSNFIQLTQISRSRTDRRLSVDESAGDNFSSHGSSSSPGLISAGLFSNSGGTKTSFKARMQQDLKAMDSIFDSMDTRSSHSNVLPVNESKARRRPHLE